LDELLLASVKYCGRTYSKTNIVKLTLATQPKLHRLNRETTDRLVRSFSPKWLSGH